MRYLLRLLRRLWSRLRRRRLSPEAAAVYRQCGDLNVIHYDRGGERYILVYDSRRWPEAYSTVWRWQANPALSFDELDMVAMGGEIYRRIG